MRMVRSLSKLFRGRLLGAQADPGEQDRGDDPSPLDIAQSSDRRAGRDGAVHLDDPTCARDGGGGGVAAATDPRTRTATPARWCAASS